MKILVLGLGNIYGGVEKYFLDRLPFLSKLNNLYFGFTDINNIPYKNELEKYNCNIINIPQLRNPINFYKTIKSIIQFNKFEVVYCNVAFSNYLLFKAAHNAGARVIVHAHNDKIIFKNKIKQGIFTLYHYIGRYLSDVYISKSYGCSHQAIEWVFGVENHAKIRKNSIKLETYRFNNDIRVLCRKELGIENNVVLACIGRLSEQKNQKFLIDIFEKYINQQPNAKLLIIGNGELEEELKHYVLQKKLLHDVYFLGVRNDIAYLLQGIDCLVMPSKSEGLGIVAIEAQASGVPCIVSNSFPCEIAFLPSFTRVSLSDDIDHWIRKIDREIKNQRVNDISIIEDNGYKIDEDLASYKEFFG